MTLFSDIFSVRRRASILCLSVVMATAVAMTACSEAPQLPPSGSQTEGAPTAEAPAPAPEPETADAAEPDGAVTEEEAAPSKPRKKSAASEDGSAPASGAEPDVAGSTVDATPAPPPPPPAAVRPFPGDSDASGSSASSEPGAPSGGGSGGSSDSDSNEGILSRGLGGRIGEAAKPAEDQPKAFDLVPVFYGTDRVVEPNAERLQYGTERGHKLELGRAMVSVPTAHKVPNIERPWVVEIPYFKYKIYEEKEDPAKHFTMQEIAALTKEQLLTYVKQRLATSTQFKDHAFVFVHGFNTSFDAAIYRTAHIAYDLKFDGAPFVYSWPSGGKVASYTYDRGSAEQAEPYLAEFLAMVVKESGAKNISLIAHSMGNEVLLRVLERMRPVVPEGVVISQVILAAPDVDRDKFSNIARQITDFAKGVTLYAASNDRALSYSARFWGGVPRAGDVPASGPLIVSGVDTIDVTSVSTDSLGLNHSGYAENKVLLEDVGALLLGGVRPPDKRLPTLLKIETPSGPFWRYPKATP